MKVDGYLGDAIGLGLSLALVSAVRQAELSEIRARGVHRKVLLLWALSKT